MGGHFTIAGPMAGFVVALFRKETAPRETKPALA